MKTDKRNDPERPVLVMTFGAKGIGDHVSCTSFVRNLAHNRPDAAIDVGVFSPIGAEIFKHDPHVRNIHLLDMDHLKIGEVSPAFAKRSGSSAVSEGCASTRSTSSARNSGTPCLPI